MIGNYPPRLIRQQKPAGSGHPLLKHLRLELRRGCLALAVLAELRTEQYGYTLRNALSDHGIGIDQGTLYPLLRRLEAQGLLSSEWRVEGKRKKRFYRLTSDGRQVLEQLLLEWKRIDLSLSGILRGQRDEAA